MRCEENRFCRSLDPDLRAHLCVHCTKRAFKKGQVIYRADIENRITLVVDGLMVTESHYDDDTLEDGDIPAFFINTSGLILGGDNLFNDEIIERYEHIRYVCLADSTIARFERQIVRTLFDTNPRFAQAMYQNITIAAGEACEFAAVLRAPNVEQSVRYLLDYASRKQIRLSQQQMADITGHNRVSISRALDRVRKAYPELWHRYVNATGQQ